MSNQDQLLLDTDKQHIWHPYSSINSDQPLFIVDHAEKSTLFLKDGRKVIDGMSSWWCMIHGYNHPVLNAAIIEQSQKMAHVMFGGLTHEPAIHLAQTLVQLSPKDLEHVFFADSGSVAVEVALKMAVQYWQSKGKPEKSKFLSLRQGYHGDTFGAMSVCDPYTGMHHLFKNNLKQNLFAPAPDVGFGDPFYDDNIAAFTTLLKENANQLAGVILEPIVQATGGMNFYSPEYLKRVRTLCDEYGVLLIADEIATGFGRTNRLFACEHADISPDILCLGKALTGGYMTLAATLCSSTIAKTICQGEAGVFMHGPTFMANPLACAVSLASINLLLDSPWQENISAIQTQLSTQLAPCKDYENVEDVRTFGAIGVVEMKAPVDLNVLQPKLVDKGVWLRPFGKLVYTMPPFNISLEDLTQITTAIKEVL